MKFVSYIIKREWWLCIETPTGKVILIQRKGRVGDCIRF